MVSIPIFDTETYFTQYSVYTYGLEEMYDVLKANSLENEQFQYMWNHYIDLNKGQSPTLLNLSVSIYKDTPEIIYQYG